MVWAILSFLISLTGPSLAPRYRLSPFETSLVEEINKMRQDPQGYASLLEEQRQYYHGDVLAFPGAPRIRTAEGAEALDEAIRDLRSTEPLPQLTVSGGLCHAARDHVEDQGKRGLVGHAGSDSSDATVRASRYSPNPAGVGENIIYGATDLTAWIMLRFLADHGIPDRGHRRNFLDPKFEFVGIACGPHAAYDGMCVLDFARNYAESPSVAAED